MENIKLLDCTLRDGGYLNDWEFGNSNIVSIFERLISAEIDIVEVGFINDSRIYDVNRTIYPNTDSINQTYGKLNKGNAIIVGMIDYGTCNIANIAMCEKSYLDGIRVIFKKERMRSAIEYCKQIKELGYKTFAQAVSITSYNDDELTELIDLVNDLEPYAFSLVDTYGLLHRGQLMHYYRFACEHLKSNIGIGYHAHNNFQLAYANCIELLENPPRDRMLIVDGSLYGMGKSAGNTPIELLVTYMNAYKGTHYHNSQLLEAIEITILELRKQVNWGYSFNFYLSASHDCHPNYVNYLLNLGKLSVKSINEILEIIEPSKKLLYDASYIKDLYFEYQKNNCDDQRSRKALRKELYGRNILLMGPGKHVYKERARVEKYIRLVKPIVIAINFIPEEYDIDFVFMSNAKRYVQLSSELCEQRENFKLIATSNVTKTEGNFDYTFNYSSMLEESALIPDNPMIMLLSMLNDVGVSSIGLAGFDGYVETSLPNYVNPNMEYIMSSKQAELINEDVNRCLCNLKLTMPVHSVTSTLYSIEMVTQ